MPRRYLYYGYQCKQSNGGPTGKVRQVFERVSHLPLKQRAKVVEFIEAFVEKKAAGTQ